MSGSRAAPRRPSTARPRADTPADVAAPSPSELEAIERQLIEQSVHSGAALNEPAGIGATIVSLAGEGPGLIYAGRVRWPVERVDELLAGLSQLMVADGAWPALVVADGLTAPAVPHLSPAGDA